MSKNEMPALLGGIPVRSETFPPYNTIGNIEIDAAVSVMTTGILSGFVAVPGKDFLGGDQTRDLENAFVKQFNTQYAVSFNSATSALHASLAAAGVGTGDQVIVSPYTMSASSTAAVMCGAMPVFVDIEPDTFCLDVRQVEAAITEHTKAIMAVNIFGLPADLGPLRSLADTYNLILVEDNAQAPAAMYNGQFTGTIGHMGVFSLNRHKTMQCGEGGVVICDDQSLARRLRLIRNHGEVVHAELPQSERFEEDNNVIGYNYRLTELQAAIALPQFNRLDELNHARVKLADYLTHRLESLNFLTPPKIREGCTHVYYLYPMIFHPEVLNISRDTFVEAMQAEGMPVANYIRPLFHIPLYRTRFGDQECYNPEQFPVVEELWRKSMIVTPICHPPLTEAHIDEFVRAIEKIALHADQFEKAI